MIPSMMPANINVGSGIDSLLPALLNNNKGLSSESLIFMIFLFMFQRSGFGAAACAETAPTSATCNALQTLAAQINNGFERSGMQINQSTDRVIAQTNLVGGNLSAGQVELRNSLAANTAANAANFAGVDRQFCGTNAHIDSVMNSLNNSINCGFVGMTDRLNGMTRDSDGKFTATQAAIQEVKCMIQDTKNTVMAEGAATRAMIESVNKDNQIRELQAALCETKQRNMILEMNYSNDNRGNNGNSYRATTSM